MPTRPTRGRGRAAAAPKDEGLKLDDAHAIAILNKAVEYEVIDEDEVPDNKRARITAASQQIDLLIEAWIKGGINPTAKEKEKKEMGLAIQDILDLAGVEIDGDDVTYGEMPELDEEPEEDGEDEPEEDGDGEAAFDIEDVIEGYEDLSAAARVKAIKALELDMDEDEDYNKAVGIYEFEEAQDKPSSRVLTFLDEMLPQDGEAEEGEDEPEEDEDAEAAGDGDGEEGGEWEQPWTKKTGAPADFDKMSAVDVKKYLDKLFAKDELSIELAQYVRDYEEQREKPPTRKRILDHVDKLLPQIEDGAGEAEPEEEAEEEKPARAGRPSAAKGLRSSLRGAKEKVTPGGLVYVVTGGDDEITAYGVNQAAGAVADLLLAGADSVTVDAG